MNKMAPALIFALCSSLIGGLPDQVPAAERMKADIGSEVEQMKHALVGKIMGGREKRWKFESVSQIKELVIRKKREQPQHRLYSITLTLQDPRAPGLYGAEADVRYEKVDSRFELTVVGLKSPKKVE